MRGLRSTIALLVVLAILGFVIALVGPLTVDRIDKARAQEEWLVLDRTVRGLAFRAFADHWAAARGGERASTLAATPRPCHAASTNAQRASLSPMTNASSFGCSLALTGTATSPAMRTASIQGTPWSLAYCQTGNAAASATTRAMAGREQTSAPDPSSASSRRSITAYHSGGTSATRNMPK